MKKKLLVLTALLLMVMPVCVFAKEKAKNEYVTMNLKETIESEGLPFEHSEYKETDDQTIIYLFRGNGCSYCKAFITFLNSITESHGKYFKLVSYEVWGHKQNSELMKEVADFLDADVGGVPFVIIGDKVFPGYSEGMNEDIKKAIMDQYESKEKYDVLEELEKEKKAEKLRETLKTYGIPALFSLVFSAVAVMISIIMTTTINKKEVSVLNDKIAKLEYEIEHLKEKPIEENTNTKIKKSKNKK